MKIYTKNNELLQRAKKATPLGAQTYSKSTRYYIEGNCPAFIERGKGCYLYDVDGNKFLDFVCALGPITIGYSDERVNEAVKQQLEKGITFSLQSEAELLLAEKVIEIIPCAEMVRFVKNGSDATAAAVRLARAYTGRDMILCSGYHGMQDWYIGSTVNNKGVPKAGQELVQPFTYNNLDEVEFLLQKYEGKVAGIILEPIQGNGPEEGFLEGLRKITKEHDVVLIFDEVVSGFRYALGGASELYNIVPDLASFGKGMGNGLAISAVAGKREIMRMIEEGVFISTTFGGDALAMAGALKSIEILEKPGTYEYMRELGSRMRKGLEDLVQKCGVGEVVQVSGITPHCGVQFEGKGSLDYLDINSIFTQRMTDEGILTVGINNLNMSHTEKEIDMYLETAERAFEDIKKAVEADSLEVLNLQGKVDPVFKRNI